jgi:hypothetical protein
MVDGYGRSGLLLDLDDDILTIPPKIGAGCHDIESAQMNFHLTPFLDDLAAGRTTLF